MKFTIEGNPVSKARHRSFIRGKHIVSYDPQEKEKLSARNQLRKQVNDATMGRDEGVAREARSLLCGSSFDVEIEFHSEPPRSAPASQKNEAFWGILNPRRADLDNFCKFILDAGNGVLWPDDRMIDSIKMIKKYSKNPHTEITVQPKESKENTEQAEILSICGPADLQNLIDDISEIATFKNFLDEWQLHSEYFDEIAYRLSKLSDKHSKMLGKISKKCPGFYLKHENNKNFEMKTSMEGKPLC